MHLEEESGGRVLLKKLDKDGPQFLRCRRATVENMRKEYFSTPDGRFRGMVVTNVFKVENQPMLHKFQKLTAGCEPGSVKGLFCSLAPGCVSRVVAFGECCDNRASLACGLADLP